MHEREFEASLERMFRETPAMPDADLFAASVERRIERGWRLRRWGLGAAGVLGGAVAVTQTLGANLSMQLEQASTGSVRAVDAVYRQAVGQANVLSTASAGLGLGDVGLGDMGMTTFWIVSGLIVLLAAGMTSRLFDEI